MFFIKKYVFLSTNYDDYLINNNPTENALIQYCKEMINTKFNKIQEIPFTSDRKLMTNLILYNNKNYIFCKGAIDVLLEKCDYIEDLLEDYLDLFTIEYDEFVNKYQKLKLNINKNDELDILSL